MQKDLGLVMSVADVLSGKPGCESMQKIKTSLHIRAMDCIQDFSVFGSRLREGVKKPTLNGFKKVEQEMCANRQEGEGARSSAVGSELVTPSISTLASSLSDQYHPLPSLIAGSGLFGVKLLTCNAYLLLAVDCATAECRNS